MPRGAGDLAPFGGDESEVHIDPGVSAGSVSLLVYLLNASY